MTKEYAAVDVGASATATEMKLFCHSFLFRVFIIARMAASRKRDGERISRNWR